MIMYMCVYIYICVDVHMLQIHFSRHSLTSLKHPAGASLSPPVQDEYGTPDAGRAMVPWQLVRQTNFLLEVLCFICGFFEGGDSFG